MGKKHRGHVWQVLSEAQKSLLYSQMHRIRNASEAAMKQVRKSIVDEWFGECSSTQMNDSTKADAHVTIINDKRLLVEVSSWVDPFLYMWKQEILRWDKRRQVWNSSESAINYILDLQLERGIIGLPAKGSRPVPKENQRYIPKDHMDENGYWINPNFIRRSVGLRRAIETSPKWTDGTFVKVLQNMLEKGGK